MPSRTIAIGDIHGCDRALEGLLMSLAPEPTDTLIVLGDVIDRGPDSKRCIEVLLNLREHCRLILIKGNHEEMLLSAVAGGDWAEGWASYGGKETLQSYGNLRSIPKEHLQFMRNALDYQETDTEIFVHAGIDPSVPLDSQSVWALRWERFAPERGNPPGDKRLICGHTAQPGGLPVIADRWICIDTGAYLQGGRLTGLDVTSGLVYQTNQAETLQLVEPLEDIAKIR
jgi:serine/threonine protein phosphatase 1